MSNGNQCNVCHIGMLRTRRVTYAAQVLGNLLLLPGIQVNFCDVCGEATYDPEIISRIEMLLGMDMSASLPSRRVRPGEDVPSDAIPVPYRRRSA